MWLQINSGKSGADFINTQYWQLADLSVTHVLSFGSGCEKRPDGIEFSRLNAEQRFIFRVTSDETHTSATGISVSAKWIPL